MSRYKVLDFRFFSFDTADHVVIEGWTGDDTLAKSVGFKYVVNGGHESHYFVDYDEAEAFWQSVKEDTWYLKVKALPNLTRYSKEMEACYNGISLDQYRNRIKLLRQAVTLQRKKVRLIKELNSMYEERTKEKLRTDSLNLTPEEKNWRLKLNNYLAILFRS